MVALGERTATSDGGPGEAAGEALTATTSIAKATLLEVDERRPGRTDKTQRCRVMCKSRRSALSRLAKDWNLTINVGSCTRRH